jgi:hypothetical protein
MFDVDAVVGLEAVVPVERGAAGAVAGVGTDPVVAVAVDETVALAPAPLVAGEPVVIVSLIAVLEGPVSAGGLRHAIAASMVSSAISFPIASDICTRRATPDPR